jgi:glyoxylase-like metal-dependent hydrolase (beta-lactamase superfamily II)
MANAQEDELHYPLGDTLPAPGASVEVAPGVRWLRMALPFALDHINLWLLRDEQTARGWTVVDCGITNDDHARRLGAGLRARSCRACPCCA